ncbi:hypothetical protein CPB84DRAFT_1515266 [Gymnopilus junonius]|uniref:Fork-head domain-containing protein n=1 Tax=Gymnopilus junonius TaxID=109634 RepID=A0A9P5TSR9_GYMJU|nr:hypothetical protein CPB84DRAFT_1515266 [Gymnopilus junonius]
MADPQVSPISQLLHTLGITREDLNKRSDQMRQFLTADDAMSSRVFERESSSRPRSGSDLRSNSRSLGSSSSFTRSLSRASSTSLRDGTPPATPIKSEPREGEIPHRRMDSMEMVIERQRRQRKNRKERDRESSRNIQHPPSPSPSNASHSGRSLDSFMQSRDDLHLPSASTSQAAHNNPSEATEPPPVTPQKSKYYREHTNLSTGPQSRKGTDCKTETPTPTRAALPPPSQNLPQAQYYAYPGYMGYSHFMPMPYRPTSTASSAFPVTPQPQRIQAPSAPSPLPPSSPPLPASSPMSSPTRPVNLVSSPGPMGPAPEENEYDNLPYKLPPGPYSPTKPDLSYAALVGRAILSSPEHRLTLQEIYDWITIVYPHYKRGETTWMNSIRHVLSTTVCFRKVPRDRSVGRTLWAIYDEDLECFKDGGFKKHLCKDYINGNDGKDKQASGSKGKARARKRADDEEAMEARKPKKPKNDQILASSSTSASSAMLPPFIGPSVVSHSLFPPTRPTTHHQPYYQSCIPQPQGFPAEVIFPPLPAAAAFNRVVTNNNASSMPVTKTNDPSTANFELSPSESRSSPIPSAPSVSSSFPSSVPELTPNRNSSSPSSSLPATSEADVDIYAANSNSGAVQINVSNSVSSTQSEPEIDSSASGDFDEDEIFNTTLLGPVKFWGQSPKAPALQPGIELLNFGNDSDGDETSSVPDRKGKQKQIIRSSMASGFPPLPSSPTLDRVQLKLGRSSTPPPSSSSSAVPSTPPRSTRPEHQISSSRTPLSHKGLHMSPSASLAHYKSNLDPPPIYSGVLPPFDVNQEGEDDDPMRTPRKRGNANPSTSSGHPVTPRRLIFSSNVGESPFRTPVGGLGASPFRTPDSRTIFDPHDPRALLNEELNRLNYGYDSPGGLFGKSRSSLLYDSPGVESAAKWW